MSQPAMPFTAKNGTEHYESDGFAWGRRHTRTGIVTLKGKGQHGTAHVTAYWDVPPNSSETPPAKVTVLRFKRTDGSRERGVTSTVLRDAERLLVRLTAAMPAQVAGLSEIDPMTEIHEAARRLPPGPRGFPTYYAHLLKVLRLIEATGTRSPVKTLAEVTGKPEGTIKLHLRRAREAAI